MRDTGTTTKDFPGTQNEKGILRSVVARIWRFPRRRTEWESATILWTATKARTRRAKAMSTPPAQSAATISASKFSRSWDPVVLKDTVAVEVPDGGMNVESEEGADQTSARADANVRGSTSVATAGAAKLIAISQYAK